MKTGSLFLSAALTLAGISTSLAQVFSENAVGYVNTVLKPGYNLISNPLVAQNNSIGELFKGLPYGTQVFKFDGVGFSTATYDDIDNAYLPASVAAMQTLPGEGVFVLINGNSDVTVTFVGEVMQGNLSTQFPKGLSIISSKVPQAGTAAELGLVGRPGDSFFQYDPERQSYYTSTFDDLDNTWLPPLRPLKVGEAVFIRVQQPGNWIRNFSVNQ